MDCSTLPACTLPWPSGVCVYDSLAWSPAYYQNAYPDVSSGWSYVGKCASVNPTDDPLTVLAYVIIAACLIGTFYLGISHGYKR